MLLLCLLSFAKRTVTALDGTIGCGAMSTNMYVAHICLMDCGINQCRLDVHMHEICLLDLPIACCVIYDIVKEDLN